MKIRINKVHFPVEVLGPGRRLGIWLQGCSLACKGCCSRDTWVADAGSEMDISALLDLCREMTDLPFHGVTVSGGEPFEQPVALHELLLALPELSNERSEQFDVLVYSGFSKSLLERKFPETLKLIDVLIPGPYVEKRTGSSVLAGSDNQVPRFANEVVQERYEEWMSNQSATTSRKLQATVDEAGIWLIGLPRRGDLEKMERQCLKEGLEFNSPSWRC